MCSFERRSCVWWRFMRGAAVFCVECWLLVASALQKMKTGTERSVWTDGCWRRCGDGTTKALCPWTLWSCYKGIESSLAHVCQFCVALRQKCFPWRHILRETGFWGTCASTWNFQLVPDVTVCHCDNHQLLLIKYGTLALLLFVRSPF